MRVRGIVKALLAWLDVDGESLRRRAVHHAIRQEMEQHPVERNECPGPRDVAPRVDLRVRDHYWRRKGE